MNKKITVKRDSGEICYCILSGDTSLEDQFNKWYFGSKHPQNGLCVNFCETSVDVVDYYHAEKMASFNVLSIEDTNEDICLKWIFI